VRERKERIEKGDKKSWEEVKRRGWKWRGSREGEKVEQREEFLTESARVTFLFLTLLTLPLHSSQTPGQTVTS
jgi:hypothetical protein